MKSDLKHHQPAA